MPCGRFAAPAELNGHSFVLSSSLSQLLVFVFFATFVTFVQMVNSRLFREFRVFRGCVVVLRRYCAIACTDALIFTSSPTRKPPASSAAFQFRPKSFRLIVTSVSKPTRALPHGSLAAPR